MTEIVRTITFLPSYCMETPQPDTEAPKTLGSAILSAGRRYETAEGCYIPEDDLAISFENDDKSGCVIAIAAIAGQPMHASGKNMDDALQRLLGILAIPQTVLDAGLSKGFFAACEWSGYHVLQANRAVSEEQRHGSSD